MKQTFEQLEVGALFKFFAGGSLLTKTSRRGYAAPQWGQKGMQVDDLQQTVIPADPPLNPQLLAKGEL